MCLAGSESARRLVLRLIRDNSSGGQPADVSRVLNHYLPYSKRTIDLLQTSEVWFDVLAGAGDGGGTSMVTAAARSSVQKAADAPPSGERYTGALRVGVVASPRGW